MDQNGLLLERYSGRPPGRLHEGQIITVRPNLCWTFDAFEIPRSHCATLLGKRGMSCGRGTVVVPSAATTSSEPQSLMHG